MWFLILTLSAWYLNTEGFQNLTADYQLPMYKAATKGRVFNLTDDNGTPIYGADISDLNTATLDNTFLVRALMRFTSERIPARSLHAKGTGAFGYFEATTDISGICKAKLFSKKGKRTKVAVRFSSQVGEAGAADTTRESVGFAVKFYTEEGNLDLISLNFPAFAMKNPVYFPSTVHALRRNPQTRVHDKNAAWDLLTSRRESILFTMFTYGDTGVSNGYRHVKGYPIHTFQIYNDEGKVSFVRFRFEPDAGVEYLSSSEAQRIGSEDPDYYARDLYEAILNHNFPSWTLSIQYMSEEDVTTADFNPFDVTLLWPEEQYPYQPIGKLVLNENLKNHFAENEQISFCPGHLVPGISGGADKLFEARRLTYELAARHRLGSNAHKIKVNCPIMSEVHTYFRDGSPPVELNEENAPNYFPNSFNGPVPSTEKNGPILIKPYVDPEATNFGQARDLYENGLTEPARKRLIQNIVSDLASGVTDFIKEKVIQFFADVHPEFGQRITDGLKNATKPNLNPVPIQD